MECRAVRSRLPSACVSPAATSSSPPASRVSVGMAHRGEMPLLAPPPAPACRASRASHPAPSPACAQTAGRYVEQAVDVRMLAIEIARPAHGKLAQQGLLHLGVEARARNAISQELKQGRVDASSAPWIVRHHVGGLAGPEQLARPLRQHLL